MKIKKLLLPLAAAVAVVSMASCDSKGKKNANYEVPAELDTTKNINIVFYHTMGENLENVLKTAIDKFHVDYPNFTVESRKIGGYNDVLNTIQTQIANDEQPNLAYCYPDHVASYNRAKAVVQLDNLIDDAKFGFTAEQKADFVEGYYNEGKSFGDDYMYTLPYSKSTEVIYYNKTEFEKNGWDVNKMKTWEGMMELCREIKKKYPDFYPLGIDSEANLFIETAEQIGSPYTSAEKGNYYLFNNDKNKAFVNQFKAWFDEGLYTTQSLLGNYTSSLFTATGKEKDGTDKKRSFISIGSTGGASHQYPKDAPQAEQFEVGVAPIPTYGNVNLKCISQGPSLCIFNKQDPQEVLATWIFVKNYLLDKEYQVAFAQESGYNPVLKSCYDVLVDDPDNPVEDAPKITYSELLAKAKGTSATGLISLTSNFCKSLVNNYFVSPAFNGSSTARLQVGDLFVAVISGTKTTDQAFEDAILECED